MGQTDVESSLHRIFGVKGKSFFLGYFFTIVCNCILRVHVLSLKISSIKWGRVKKGGVSYRKYYSSHL